MLHAMIHGSVKGRARRILVIVGIGVTVAASVPPQLPPQSHDETIRAHEHAVVDLIVCSRTRGPHLRGRRD